MSNAVFIDDWNSIIPFKITTGDLERPTEQFLYKAILNVFRLMHYDVSSYENMYNEPVETLTVKRVELVKRINYIYQLCSDSKQTSFFYVDLVKPTVKKVIHLLKILLNYLFYINMVRETVLEKTNDCTERYFELNAKLNQEQIVTEDNKIRANNINRHIDDLKHQLPQLTSQIEKLVERRTVIQNQLVTLKENHHELADKIVQMKIEQAKLAEQKVTDEEMGALKTTNESLQSDIETLIAVEKQLQENNAINVKAFREMKPCIALSEKLLKFTFDDSCKDARRNEEELKLQIEKAENKYKDLLGRSDAINVNCTEVESYLEELQQDLAARMKVLGNNDRTNDSKFNIREKYVGDLQETNELLEQIIKVQKKETERIIKMCEESLTLIKQ